METAPKLKDTTLLMMVRDEMINPAGGIYPILTMQAPLYEQTIVVDTGSKDGTRQLLEQLVSEIPNLSVYDLPFEGFGDTRTKAAKYVPTRYIMFLDADELVLGNSIAELSIFRDTNPFLAGIDIPIYDVLGGWGEIKKGGWNPRLYQKEKAGKFNGNVWEFLEMNGKVEEASHAKLLHFKPTQSIGTKNKHKWYDHIYHAIRTGMAPSDDPNYLSWKQPDPKLLEKYEIPYQESLERLEELGLSTVTA